MKPSKLYVFLILGLMVFSANSQIKDPVPVPLEKATIKNLKDAIKGETTASAKYLAYSVKAKQEGYNNIALLFEAASKSENIHASNHIAVLEKLGGKMDEFKPEFEVKSTKENLEDALKGETYEVEKMYPEFLKTATDESVKEALTTFDFAYNTEMKHKTLYQNAINQLKDGNENKLPVNYFICPVCGNTMDTQALNECDICATPKDKFTEVKI